MLGVLWYFATLVVAFIVLVARLGSRLSLIEAVTAAVPVGTIGGAWLFYLVSCLLSAME
jgi:hypothetical protein